MEIQEPGGHFVQLKFWKWVVGIKLEAQFPSVGIWLKICSLICESRCTWPKLHCFIKEKCSAINTWTHCKITLCEGILKVTWFILRTKKCSSRLTFRYLIHYWLLLSSGLPSCGNIFASSIVSIILGILEYN